MAHDEARFGSFVQAASAMGEAARDDAARVAALRSYRLLDTPPERAFDRITGLASRILEMPMSLVSLVDADRQWFKSRCGVESQETPRAIAFCDHVIRGSDIMIVPDAHQDPRFIGNPLVTGGPRIRFYAGVPLIDADGFALGSFCVMDHVPRELDARGQEILRELAAQVVHEMTVRSHLGDLYSQVDGAQHAARKLISLREQLDSLLNATSSAAITVDESDRVASWNHAAEVMFGYSAAEAIGMKLQRVLPCGKDPCRVPGEAVHDHARACGLPCSVRGKVCQGRHKDGRELPVEVTFASWTTEAGGDGVGAILRDVSDLRRREEDLLRTQTHLAEAQRIGAMGSWDWDLATGKINMSAEMSKLLGVPPGQRRTLQDALGAIHADDRAAWQMAMNRMIEGEEASAVTYRMCRPDGAIRIFQSIGQTIENADGPHLVGVLRDITDQSRQEAELRQSEKLAALGQLAGGVAHEINNLLQPIITFSELIEEDLADLAEPEATESMREQLSVMGICGRQAREIVRKILRYARQEVIAVELADVPAALTTAVDLITELLSPGVRLAFKIADHATGTARLNTGELAQVVTNLAVNADHAMNGHGHLEIVLERDEIGANLASSLDIEPGVHFVIRMRDTGCGMDAATVAKIFDPFFTTKPLGQGTGLGLSMVHGILKSWRGAIAVDSEPGAGTEFRLYIPAADS